MGRISATFKADEAETANNYSISEWWLEPNCTGPGAHSHDEDDVFFILEGTMSVFLDDHWIDAPAGSFVLIPGGTKHDFQIRSDKRAGLLNFTNGVFETEMPGISQWFIENPPGKAV
jgi:quercetin dioxygenase-like cupin family protein